MPALQPAVAAAMSAKPSCWTSRSRTAPSTRPSQPSSSRNTWARTGSTSAKSASAGAQPAGGDPHVVELLGIFPEPCPGLLVAQHGELAAQDRKGELTHGRRLRDVGGSEVGRAGDLQTHGEEAGLELRQTGRLQTARCPQLINDRVQGLEPLGPYLDLHPTQLHGPLTATDDDHGVVERDLRRVDAADAQSERPAPRADLEDLAQAA